jgi:hypothetical protein
MKTSAQPDRAVISHARAKAILDAALPYSDRAADHAAGKRCADPDLLAYQNTHPLAILSGMTCEYFTWAPNDAPQDGRGFVDPLARQARIGGAIRSPRFNDRTPAAAIGGTLRDLWSSKRADIYRHVLGSPKTCQAPGCATPINLRLGDYDVDHVDPQHAEMVRDLFDLLGGPVAEADWWGYRWRQGASNGLREHLILHPIGPLTVLGFWIDCGTYQALCKPCHKAATKARKVAS